LQGGLLVSMQKNSISISYEDYSSLDELSPVDKTLCLEAVKALANSHSPYSGFRVGAAVLLESGKIVHGSNQENVAYPSGLCAERVALFTVGSSYPNDKIVSMAITAHTDHFKIMQPVTSCGACLQVMAEYEKKQSGPIEVLFYCQNGQVIKTDGVKSLLPFAFAETRLKK
jgi:cytidine deaminase